jgi:hypothetical protein
MISSTSSSSERRALLLLAVTGACWALAARAAGDQGTPRTREPRLVLLPVTNLSGAPVPLARIQAALEAAVARAGAEVVSGDLVEPYLARHRIRWTGGITGPEARAAREDLGADGILVAQVGLHALAAPPKVALFMRLVTAEDPPRVVWADEVGRAGDDAPGLLGLGVVDDLGRLEAEATARLTRSLAAHIRGKAPPPSCPAPARRQRPRSSYGGGVALTEHPSVAVLPFVNEARHRDAGELVALEFVHRLAATGRFQPLEPGAVRDQLLGLRMVLESGISVDAARALLGTLDADLVVTGYVHEYQDPAGSGAPRVAFTAFALDRRSGRIAWQASSHSRGDEGVWFFDSGRVSTARDLACRMVRGAVEDLDESAARAPSRGRATNAPAGAPTGKEIK